MAGGHGELQSALDFLESQQNALQAGMVVNTDKKKKAGNSIQELFDDYFVNHDHTVEWNNYIQNAYGKPMTLKEFIYDEHVPKDLVPLQAALFNVFKSHTPESAMGFAIKGIFPNTYNEYSYLTGLSSEALERENFYTSIGLNVAYDLTVGLVGRLIQPMLETENSQLAITDGSFLETSLAKISKGQISASDINQLTQYAMDNVLYHDGYRGINLGFKTHMLDYLDSSENIEITRFLSQDQLRDPTLQGLDQLIRSKKFQRAMAKDVQQSLQDQGTYMTQNDIIAQMFNDQSIKAYENQIQSFAVKVAKNIDSLTDTDYASLTVAAYNDLKNMFVQEISAIDYIDNSVQGVPTKTLGELTLEDYEKHLQLTAETEEPYMKRISPLYIKPRHGTRWRRIGGQLFNSSFDQRRRMKQYQFELEDDRIKQLTELMRHKVVMHQRSMLGKRSYSNM